VHLVDSGIDTGPVLVQEPVPVRDDDTPETLHARIQLVEHRLLPTAVRSLLA
jgi:phosphoribosylglycinamide formyltransferase 1